MRNECLRSIKDLYLISRSQSVHRAYLVRRQRFAEQIYRAHLSAKHALLVQFGGRSDVAFVEGLERAILSGDLVVRGDEITRGARTYVIRRDEPCHLRARRQLTVHQTLNLTFCPPIVYVHYRDHIPLEKIQVLTSPVDACVNLLLSC